MRPDSNRQPGFLSALSWIAIIILIGAAGYFCWQAFTIGIFSNMQLLIGGCILAFILILFLCLLIKKYEHIWVKVLMIILSLALSLICGFGGYYLQQTSAFFSVVSGGNADPNDPNASILNDADVLSNKVAMTVTTYAMHETEITKPDQLNGKRVGVIRASDEKGTDGALDQLKTKGATSPDTVEYENAFALVDALFAGNVDAIVLPEQFHEDLLNAANDFNQYNALTTFTNTVDQYIYYEPMPDEMKNPADPVADITKDPFTIFISGADSYGNLSATSRSDVNMLVTVNPVTHQVLLVSLPRDTYLPITCKKNTTACANFGGAEDKLTHSGIYGIGTTESSIEDFLDIEINYTVRVNFSSLINIVDSIGGIDVEVEPGLEVDTFYANGTEGVKAGMNHLDGERALAFARERHAYLNGDNQRIINQQIVLKSLLSKMMSPAMVVNYPNFIRALSTAFFTNMPSNQIKALIGLEISSFPSWNIQSYAISGDPDMLYSPSLNATSSVLVANPQTVEMAGALIDDVLDGKTVNISDNTSESDSSTTTSTRRRRKKSSEDESETSSEVSWPEYVPEEPGYNEPVYDNPVYDPPTYQTPVTDPGYYDPGYNTIPDSEETVYPASPSVPTVPDEGGAGAGGEEIPNTPPTDEGDNFVPMD